MISMKSFAGVCALVLTGHALAAADGFESMTFDEYRATLREANLAIERKDFAKAYEHYSKTACMGDKRSQFALGTLFLTGDGVAPNGVKAYAWYAVSAETKEPDHQRALEKVDKLIPPAYREQADKLAEHYLAEYGLKGAATSCDRRRVTGSQIPRLECNPPVNRTTGRVDVKLCVAGDP
jgi:TPR repeat protein